MDNITWPKVSLIISNLNGKEMLKECLESLERLDYPNYEIIVVDAGSTDGAPEMVSKEFPRVRLLREKRIGIGEAINKGLIAAQGDINAFDINNDEVFSRDWLKILVGELLSSKEKKVVEGVRLVHGSKGVVDAAGGLVRFNGFSFVRGRHEKFEDLPKIPTEVTYAGTPVFKRELLNVIGFCDEKYYIWCEDVDFCEKARRAGYKILSIPSAISYHKRGATLKSLGAKTHYYIWRNRVRLFIKHYSLVRMFVALAIWAGYLAGNMVVILSSSRRILSLIGIRSAHMPKSRELFMALLESIFWNLKNLEDHFRARAVIQSIKPIAEVQ